MCSTEGSICAAGILHKRETFKTAICIYQSQSFYGMDAMFVRKNANCFILFELNERDLSQIIQSINHGMDKEKFKNYCKTQWRNPDDYGYLFVNIRKPCGKRVMTNIC